MTTRRQAALTNRLRAAEEAAKQLHPQHVSNGDERASMRYALSFTKGLPHDYKTGLVASNADYEQFVRAIDSADEQDFIATPLGPPNGQFFTAPHGSPLRAWESQGAGSAFDLEGPDAQAVTMPPAPSAGSAELIAEMGEVYVQALLRDMPFSALAAGAVPHPPLKDALAALNELDWFAGAPISALTPDAHRRRRGGFTPQTAFRGIAPGDDVGPYISQFLLQGNAGLGDLRSPSDGLIQFGAQTISQRVRRVKKEDFMTSWEQWLDVQNALDTSGSEKYHDQNVFVGTGRDLSTYVHYDALYQAYLNACLILLARGVPFDPGVPFQADNRIDHQQGFAHFGPAHILSLVTEVATRALKAVRFQKFNVHRRLRPEALAARLEKADHLPISSLRKMRAQLEASPIGQEVLDKNLNASGTASLLLPMAFPEGSPMHPSYGAGHAIVAGACVTVLKAFFDHSELFMTAGSAANAFVVDDTGDSLRQVDVFDGAGEPAELTVEGELNKLAANISIGRNWAGVHYFTDYWESIRIGEAIALQILREQKTGFQENFSMTVPLFEGGAVRI